MNMLSIVYTLALIAAVGFLAWLYTSSGKKWLNGLQ